jgi:hypothetical protein
MRRRDFIAFASVAVGWPRTMQAQQSEPQAAEPLIIPKAWLKEKTTVAEADAAHPGISDDRVKRFPDAAKPFGFQNRQWEEFKALVLPGDELWTFSSPPDSWEHLAGRAGVALVRDGVPVRVIITMMN